MLQVQKAHLTHVTDPSCNTLCDDIASYVFFEEQKEEYKDTHAHIAIRYTHTCTHSKSHTQTTSKFN